MQQAKYALSSSVGVFLTLTVAFFLRAADSHDVGLVILGCSCLAMTLYCAYGWFRLAREKAVIERVEEATQTIIGSMDRVKEAIRSGEMKEGNS